MSKGIYGDTFGPFIRIEWEDIEIGQYFTIDPTPGEVELVRIKEKLDYYTNTTLGDAQFYVGNTDHSYFILPVIREHLTAAHFDE